MKEETHCDVEGGEDMCAVCGDRATGTHYRVLSCEGCKGFWRRTIQRGMGAKYSCKLWTEQCPVTPETRGRCQRCRYLACVRAGMVADLVMADKERLSRLRLVDQNREKRRQERGIPPTSQDQEIAKQDRRLLDMFSSLHLQHMGGQGGSDLGVLAGAAFGMVETLLYQLMGERVELREVAMSAHLELVTIHLVTSRPEQLARVPLLGSLAQQVQGLALSIQELAVSCVLSATRPRMTWPPSIQHELNMLWDLIAGTVRRSCTNDRMAAILQVVHQVQTLNFYMNPLTLLSGLGEALQFPASPSVPTSNTNTLPDFAFPSNPLIVTNSITPTSASIQHPSTIQHLNVFPPSKPSQNISPPPPSPSSSFPLGYIQPPIAVPQATQSQYYNYPSVPLGGGIIPPITSFQSDSSIFLPNSPHHFPRQGILSPPTLAPNQFTFPQDYRLSLPAYPLQMSDPLTPQQDHLSLFPSSPFLPSTPHTKTRPPSPTPLFQQTPSVKSEPGIGYFSPPLDTDDLLTKYPQDFYQVEAPAIFSSPPREEGERQGGSPSSVPPKKRKFNPPPPDMYLPVQ